MKTSTKRKSRNTGFTLLEALFASILLGLAIVSLVAANGAFTASNWAGVEMSTAEFLVEEIREFTANMPVSDPDDTDYYFGHEAGEASGFYDDIDDFYDGDSDGIDICPPIDANGEVLNDFSEFTQHVQVLSVLASDLQTSAGWCHHGSDFLRVTVSIYKNGNQITQASWIRTDLD